MRGFAVVEIVTTSLEIIGLIMLCVAAGVAVGHYSLPGGLAATGALLIGVSLLLTRSGSKPVPQ